jgi:hypothetical protein
VIVNLDATTGSTGQKNVAAAGTAEQLSASVVGLSEGVYIRAKSANTSLIFWGFASTVSSTTGVQLAAGEAVMIPVKTGSAIWINASVSGEGVSFALI